MTDVSIDLNGTWQMVEEYGMDTVEATVPGTVQTDLMAAGRLPDPFIGTNEDSVLSIENKNWKYVRSFTLADGPWKELYWELQCDGIDSYAEIKINGSPVGATDNMHRAWHFDLNQVIKPGKNTIEVVLRSPFNFLKKEVEENGYVLPADNESGEMKYSPFSRKAHYHFGWDWAPRIVAQGIWKDISIRGSNTLRIRHAGVETLNLDTSVAEMILKIVVHSHESVKVDYSLGDLVVGSELIEEGETEIIDTFFISDPDLWWPNGLGEATLYQADLALTAGEATQFKNIKFGIRTIELISEKDSIGTSFYFKINDKPFFVKGANYIPQDMFLPKVSDKRYRTLLKAAKEANMNMIRVWGGGIYEKDIFYDLCDSLGLLVWQDFMFAGTMYPPDEVFAKNIADEAEYQIRRLRGHPSLALWCGNNEIDVAWENWGWQEKYGYDDQLQVKLWQGHRRIFYDLLPSLVEKYSGTIGYTPTSPLSNWGQRENFDHGSMHYWGVWHGREDIDSFAVNVGRFMVEYGMQSYPDIRTIIAYAAEDTLSMNATFFTKRQKSYIGNDEIIRQVTSRYGGVVDAYDFVGKSHDLQAEGLSIAIDAHLKSQGKCMGSLIWQLNDCWPGPSWSLIDYAGRKKKAYYAVQKAFSKEGGQ